TDADLRDRRIGLGEKHAGAGHTLSGRGPSLSRRVVAHGPVYRDQRSGTPPWGASDRSAADRPDSAFQRDDLSEDVRRGPSDFRRHPRGEAARPVAGTLLVQPARSALRTVPGERV